MNKDLFDQIPAEEQPVASKINSLVKDMQPSQAFQSELENQLMDKATTQPAQRWFTKLIIPLGWAVVAIGGVLLLNWIIGSFAPQPSPAAGPAATGEVSFAAGVRSGNLCMSTLAVGHGFAVFLTNPEKTEFAAVDAGNTIFEIRSFAWSPNGEQLAIVGNSMGTGSIHIADPVGGQIQYLLSGSEVGYLMDAAWSRDGKQLLMWSSQNNKILYLVSADGSGLVEKELDLHIIGTPQFAPDGQSIVFYGSDTSSASLFEVSLDTLQRSVISTQVEDETAFAFSPNGSRLAYIEMDRNTGEARLVSQEVATGSKTVLGTLPIPKGSGSSLPESANLSWSGDGKSLVFDFGRNAADRVIYLAQADGTGLVKVAEAAYAPSISADGRCLAYISEDQVFLMDLTTAASNSTARDTMLLADLPTGRGVPNFKQDKLQWRPR